MNHLINKILVDLRANELLKKDVKHFFFGHSYALSGDMMAQGVIEVIPVSTSVASQTTGLQDQSVHELQIVLIKNMKTQAYKNAQVETGLDYLNRVMDGRQPDGAPNTNSIRYIIRNNMRNYGTVQRDISIDYQPEDPNYEGAASATLSVTQEEFNVQPIS